MAFRLAVKRGESSRGSCRTHSSAWSHKSHICGLLSAARSLGSRGWQEVTLKWRTKEPSSKEMLGQPEGRRNLQPPWSFVLSQIPPSWLGGQTPSLGARKLLRRPAEVGVLGDFLTHQGLKLGKPGISYLRQMDHFPAWPRLPPPRPHLSG